MSQEASTPNESVFATLRRLKQPRPAEEHCEFCDSIIVPAHRHLLEVVNRHIICACDACALRFTDVVGGRFKLIPRDARVFPNFEMTDAQWEGFALPINLTFLYHSTTAGKMVAMYPSPAGATESLLPMESWTNLVHGNPTLAEMEPDVEALLINRVGDGRDYFIAPIDRCYELAGLIRVHWRGLSGGEKVWQEIEGFFNRLRETAEQAQPAEAPCA